MMNPTISLDEPWASLVAARIKVNETRSWPTKHRGLIFIHATVKPFGFNSARADLLRDFLMIDEYRKLCRHLWVQKYGKAEAKKHPAGTVDCEMWSNYMPGHVIAVAQLTNCVPSDDYGNPDTWGDFTRGRWVWELEHVRALDIVKYARGRQRIWDWKEGPFQPDQPPRENPYL
jgi:hypothetical protein